MLTNFHHYEKCLNKKPQRKDSATFATALRPLRLKKLCYIHEIKTEMNNESGQKKKLIGKNNR